MFFGGRSEIGIECQNRQTVLANFFWKNHHIFVKNWRIDMIFVPLHFFFLRLSSGTTFLWHFTKSLKPADLPTFAREALAGVSAPCDRAGECYACETGPNGQRHRRCQNRRQCTQSAWISLNVINKHPSHFKQIWFAETPEKFSACDKFACADMRPHDSAAIPALLMDGAQPAWNTSENH